MGSEGLRWNLSQKVQNKAGLFLTFFAKLKDFSLHSSSFKIFYIHIKDLFNKLREFATKLNNRAKNFPRAVCYKNAWNEDISINQESNFCKA